MKKVYLYKKFERFWHWSQAALIMTLMVMMLLIAVSIIARTPDQAAEPEASSAFGRAIS